MADQKEMTDKEKFAFMAGYAAAVGVLGLLVARKVYTDPVERQAVAQALRTTPVSHWKLDTLFGEEVPDTFQDGLGEMLGQLGDLLGSSV